MTRRQALDHAAARFVAAGISSARLDADLLLIHVLGVERVELRLRPDQVVPDDAERRFLELVEMRASRVPIAQILGSTEFWSRRFVVSADVLTPRSETEGVVQVVLDLLRGTERPSAVLADIGTGSGCLAVTLALELPQATVHAVDLSPAALQVARRNARELGAEARVRFHEGSFCEPLVGCVSPGSVDVVVSNPPYVRPSEEPTVDPEVLREPRMAVFCGEQPSDVYAEIAEQAAPLVRPGGYIVFELPEDPAGEIRTTLHALSAWSVVNVLDDLAGTPRVLVACRNDAATG